MRTCFATLAGGALLFAGLGLAPAPPKAAPASVTVYKSPT
jgi:hypothetical protein